MDRTKVRAVNVAGWPLPDEYLVELGRISALWSSLEAALMICLSKLAGFNDPRNPVPFILTAHASFPQRLDMLGTLCEQLSPDHPRLRECPSVLTKLRAAQKSRNRFIHNGLTFDAESNRMEIAFGSARGKLKVAVETVEAVDLRAACIDIHEAQRALAHMVLGTQIPSKLDDHDA
jgi:hypothetical protein